MKAQWKCYFKEDAKELQVGTRFFLSCKGENSVSFNKEKLVVQFNKKKDKYKLQILEVLYSDPQSLELLATSYRTGDFKQDFFITDGKKSVVVKDLKFSVSSVLPEKPIPPHPAFGPFKNSFPPFYFFLWIFTLVLLFVSVGLILRTFINRKSFLKKMLDSPTRPAKLFVKSVRQLDKSSSSFSLNLKKHLNAFIEQSLCITAENKSSEELIKSFKKYHPQTYKKQAEPLNQILKEIQYFENKEMDEVTAVRLERACFYFIFDLEKELKT